MSRGADNKPDDKHWGAGTKCEIVTWEQDSHRDASRANAPPGFINAPAGSHWQSHHIICISSLGARTAKDPPSTALMEKALYITKWNINEAPNMIGLPQRCQYRQSYGGAEVLPAAAQTAAWAAVEPKNLPSHNNDHNTTGGYTEEVTKYLKREIWDKFNSQNGDHGADAQWLKDQLEAASRHYQSELISRGSREPKTVEAWKQRFTLTPGWEDPFSMAEIPTERYGGLAIGDLTNIFKALPL